MSWFTVGQQVPSLVVIRNAISFTNNKVLR